MEEVKKIVFDIDGVLIEADGEVRKEKYRALFELGMELINDPAYGGSNWLFERLKEKYDRGIYIDPRFYRLINPDTPAILEELAKKYELYACSLAEKTVSLAKLKASGIDKYFKDILLKPIKFNDKTIAVVEDRIIDYGDCCFIRFHYGQHKNQIGRVDKVINNLNELLQ